VTARIDPESGLRVPERVPDPELDPCEARFPRRAPLRESCRSTSGILVCVFNRASSTTTLQSHPLIRMR
jgi:hypothetical protein